MQLIFCFHRDLDLEIFKCLQVSVTITFGPSSCQLKVKMVDQKISTYQELGMLVKFSNKTSIDHIYSFSYI